MEAQAQARGLALTQIERVFNEGAHASRLGARTQDTDVPYHTSALVADGDTLETRIGAAQCFPDAPVDQGVVHGNDEDAIGLQSAGEISQNAQVALDVVERLVQYNNGAQFGRLVITAIGAKELTTGQPAG